MVMPVKSRRCSYHQHASERGPLLLSAEVQRKPLYWAPTPSRPALPWARSTALSEYGISRLAVVSPDFGRARTREGVRIGMGRGARATHVQDRPGAH